MADCRLMAATRGDYVGAALTSVHSLLTLTPSVRPRLIFQAASHSRDQSYARVPGNVKRDSFPPGAVPPPWHESEAWVESQ